MIAQEFSQFRQLAWSLSGPALRRLVDQGGPVVSATHAVLRGVPAALLLLEDRAELHPFLADGFRALARDGRATAAGQLPELRDPVGHGRDVYHPLVLHLHLAAFARLYETLPVSLWSVCEDALGDACLGARAVEAFADVPPPAERTAMVLWQALCLLEQAQLASRDVEIELVESVVHQIIARPGPGGALHERAAGGAREESLDAWTYRELAGLHALTNLALARRNRAWAARVEEIALYHLENTQPDNTTNEPWALAAFVWSPRTRSFAEQQLHDTTAQGQGGSEGLGAVAALLLADAGHALEAFEPR